MRSSEEIEKLVKKMRFSPRACANERILKYAETALKQRIDKTKSKRFEVNIWSTIMNKPLTRIAAAAAGLLIVVLGITFLEKSVTPAWAIEQTIDALRQLNAIHFSGVLLDEEGKEVSFEAWARANEEQTASEDLRIEAETGVIDLVSGNRRYQYDPATATVKITEGYGPATSSWPGGDFFESLEKMVFDWNETYGRDPATNRDRVFVTCSHPAAPEPRSWWFEFDVESKLPVSIKQWGNMRQEGVPTFDVKSLTYFETLPDELFHFEIPEGAEIVPALAERDNKLQDPNFGMSLGNLTEEQASTEITRRYWQAVIDQDWNTVAILCPTSSAGEWEDKYSGGGIREIVEMKEPYRRGQCVIVPCSIRLDSGATTTIRTTVILREIEGKKSCVIANTQGEGVE